jgi:glucose-6-phosphate isomerase
MSALLTNLTHWKSLESHFGEIKNVQLKDLFEKDSTRGERFVLKVSDIYFDYSKHRITEETMSLLLGLAEERGLEARRAAMFSGEKINSTENRAVLHTALRAPKGATVLVDGHNVVPDVHAVLEKMTEFSKQVRSGTWKGHTGKSIKYVINIGIGGSDLGPVMAYEALKHFSQRNLSFRFVSNVDGNDFAEAVEGISAEETLFIISSKTFSC